MVRKTIDVEKTHLMNGQGTVLMKQIVEPGMLYGKGRTFAHMVLKPGVSIGLHRHIGETEPYYILKGKGDFTDADGTVRTVEPGDCCLIEPGQTHGIHNAYEEDLEFIALIYNSGDEAGHAEAVDG